MPPCSRSNGVERPAPRTGCPHRPGRRGTGGVPWGYGTARPPFPLVGPRSAGRRASTDRWRAMSDETGAVFPGLLPDRFRQAAKPGTVLLRLETTQSREGVLDGAWWPRSRDVGAELPGLVRALTEHSGPRRASAWTRKPGTTSRPAWSSTAGRCTSTGIRVGDDTVIVTRGDRDHFSLLAVPPQASLEAALAAMARAGAGTGRRSTTSTPASPTMSMNIFRRHNAVSSASSDRSARMRVIEAVARALNTSLTAPAGTSPTPSPPWQATQLTTVSSPTFPTATRRCSATPTSPPRLDPDRAMAVTGTVRKLAQRAAPRIRSGRHARFRVDLNAWSGRVAILARAAAARGVAAAAQRQITSHPDAAKSMLAGVDIPCGRV
ncbi:DUF5994 family protein [Streptomyces sp. 1114.5]|uniref:DUF5994 family protein n=1 Tax=Streptomyces sp. 1114.5 TaxID=1938830 RepID=UPI002877C4A1|nr:DUF5994 family protein [Streptomyces sp. 1114.5]